MNPAALVLLLLDLAYIGSLPVFFFRRDGRLGFLWWATAAPFFACAVLLLLAGLGVLHPFPRPPDAWSPVLAALAVPPAAGSIALLSYTLGSHRARLALWHQVNDAPAHLVTHGAYERIRHPFYSSFLLALVGALVLFPHPGTLLSLVYGFWILNRTAQKEESRLLASEFGREYGAYVSRTGRFWPRRRREAR